MPRLARALSIAVVVTAVFATTGQADRRTALSGNLLIDDQDDVFLFPNQIVRYQNMITIDYGPTADAGSGLFTMGDDIAAFGVSLRRGDALSPHGTPGNSLATAGPQLGTIFPPTSLFSAGEFSLGDTPVAPQATIDEPPVTMLDLFYGQASPSSDWGLRLSLGRGADVTTDTAGDETGQEQLYLMGEFGYGMGQRGQETRTDLSISALVDLGNAVVGGADAASGLAIAFDGLLRMYFPMNPDMDLGLLGNLGVSSTSVSNDTLDPAPSTSLFGFGLGGGVGPAMRFGDANVAAYGTLRLAYQTVDPNSEVDDDSGNALALVVPGMLASVEVPVTDWFYVRSGAQYDFALVSTGADDDSGTSSAEGSFSWNAGLGVLVDDFRFDGTVQEGFVTGGPNFIGGGTGFLAMASLTYVFDKKRDGMHRPTEAEAALEPVPAPEPAPEPEPVYTPSPAAPPVPAEPAPPGPPSVPEPEDGSSAAVVDGDAQGNASAGDNKVEASGAGALQIGGGVN